jgi:hypothetical protein
LRPGRELKKYGIKREVFGELYFETWKKKLGKYDIKEKCFGDLYFETWKEKREFFWRLVF